MAIEYTLSIIKPDAVERNLTGKINTKFETAGLKIVAQKMMQLSEKTLKNFMQFIKLDHFTMILLNL